MNRSGRSRASCSSALSCAAAIVAVWTAVAAAPRAAHAEAPAPRVVLPRPVSSLHVNYPAGGQGDRAVILEVTIDADGTVRSARAVETEAGSPPRSPSGSPPAAGAEAFADAAVAAAKSWRFEPATRAGVPVAARVRVRIGFTAAGAHRSSPSSPKAAPVPSKPAAGTPASLAPGASSPSILIDDRTIEVNVLGERPPPGVTSLTRAEVRVLPGAFGDPFRAIESMPGVTPIVSGIPYFYVRGAPPGNVGYFIDGIRVPLLFHLGLGPSVIHPSMVDRVDLYPGGYPARFGRYSGGIVAGETRTPAADLRAEGSLRLVDAGALVQAPLPGNSGTALLGGRYSYTAALASLVSSNVELDYWDYQGRVAYDITPRDQVSAFFFGSYDFLGDKGRGGVTRTLFSTEFHRLDLRYDSILSDRTTLRQAITVGTDSTGLDNKRYVLDRMIAARSQINHRLGSSALLRASTDITLDLYEVDLVRDAGGDDLADLFPSRRDLAIGVGADMVLRVTPSFEVTPGVRVDFWSSAGAVTASADARLAARLSVRDWLRINHAVGLAHQAPSFILPGPALQVGGLKGGLQHSFQQSAGVEADLPAAITASATFFFNGFFNMTDALGTSPTDTRGPDDYEIRSLGSAVGLELYARRRLTERLSGYVSYTLSRSTRSASRASFPSQFDRTHVATGAITYDFGSGFRVGTRLVFYTGRPNEAKVNPSASNPITAGVEVPDRLPAYFRIDGRVEKRWIIGKRGWLSLVLEVLNATLAKEVLSVECGTYECNEGSFGPVTIPSFGIEGGF